MSKPPRGHRKKNLKPIGEPRLNKQEYLIGVSLAFSQRGRCPHSIRLVDELCSQCLGVIVARTVRAPSVEIATESPSGLRRSSDDRADRRAKASAAARKRWSSPGQREAASRSMSARRGCEPPIEGARERACQLRAEGRTIQEIADQVRSSASSVCRWLKGQSV